LPVTDWLRALWRRQLIIDTRIDRLRTVIAQKRAQLGAVEAPRAMSLLDQATEHAAAFRVNEAWACVLECDHAMIDAFDAVTLQAQADLIRVEARSKLKDWRGDGVRALLGAAGTPVPPGKVKAALRMLHEDFHNSYFKIDLVAMQIARMALIGGAIVLAVIALAYIGVPPLGPYATDMTWAALLGALGGLLSALRTLTRSVSRKIPAHLAGWPVTLVRPVIGAVAGIAAWLIIATGIVTVAADLKQLAPLVGAFLAGFSERYFLSLVPGTDKRGESPS
jgi:hypothetical protein